MFLSGARIASPRSATGILARHSGVACKDEWKVAEIKRLLVEKVVDIDEATSIAFRRLRDSPVSLERL